MERDGVFLDFTRNGGCSGGWALAGAGEFLAILLEVALRIDGVAGYVAGNHPLSRDVGGCRRQHRESKQHEYPQWDSNHECSRSYFANGNVTECHCQHRMP